MGRIVVSDNVSLDGVIQDPVGDEGFPRGGWVGLIKDRPDLARITLDEARSTEAMLMGRRTYEWFAARWPSRTGELADRLNSLPKHVVSSTLEDPIWNNSTVVKGDVLAAISKLKRDFSGAIVDPIELPDRAHADGARPRRRDAAEGFSGRAWRRRAPLRRDQRQEADAPRRRPDPRRRHRVPHLRARTDGAWSPGARRRTRRSRRYRPRRPSARRPCHRECGRSRRSGTRASCRRV